MSTRAADPVEMARVRESAPPTTAVLTLAQLAAWLQVGTDTAMSLGLPAIAIGKQLRYPVGMVLREIEKRASRAA